MGKTLVSDTVIIYYDKIKNFPKSETQYQFPNIPADSTQITIYLGSPTGAMYIHRFTVGVSGFHDFSFSNHKYRVGYDGNNVISYQLMNLVTSSSGYMEVYAEYYVVKDIEDAEDTKNIESTSSIYEQTLASCKRKSSTAKTWEYTGLSFTIEAPTLLFLYSTYSSKKPLGLGCGSKSDLTAPNKICYESDCCVRTPVYCLAAGTYYLYEKRSGIADKENTIGVKVLGIKNT